MQVTIKVKKPGTAPGFIFVAPYTFFGVELIGQTGSLIMDQAGNPIWFRPLPNRFIQNTDFRMQLYQDKPVLTMWEGTISGTQSANPNLPYGDAEPGARHLIFDQHYRLVHTVMAQNGYTSDLHEFTITRRNTALLIGVKQVPGDLTPYGGPANGFFDNHSIQEIDLQTGELIFFWDVLAHVNPADSMVPASSAESSNGIWDCFHVNSIEEGPNDTLLVSMRHMWAIYNIDKKTGNIIWQLGGKRSSFTLGPNASFSWQHDARYRSGDRISLFDNAYSGMPGFPPQSQAHGLILKLDMEKMTAVADRTYYHDPALFVISQGNMQQLPNGNKFVGWGQDPYLSEFAEPGNTPDDPAVNLLYEVQYSNQNLSYRTFKKEWVGLPLNPPNLVVHISDEVASLFVSWNGSTETVAWKVLAGTALDCLQVIVDHAAQTGFETEITVFSEGPFFQVKALDRTGHVIGTSLVVKGEHDDDE
ncbi:arylsulfotransferase family protein [Paenibacillus sp. PR3]|uniref:Arylsulfotransferase family protein n=2 Tax=Paenibacillus terricola TaxID=2763503 RepID=A0ABR8MTQ1_9BACL|nr:arylsulfotransferase family protein [Paenibacillus terricola]